MHAWTSNIARRFSAQPRRARGWALIADRGSVVTATKPGISLESMDKQMKAKIAVITLFLAAVAVPAYAQSYSQSGTLTGYIPFDDGAKQILIFQLANNVQGGCNATARFAIDSNAPKFKGTVAAVMAAYHAQTPVTVIYTQTCNSWSNAWDVGHICVGHLPC